MTEGVMAGAKSITAGLFAAYCTREPSNADILRVFKNCYVSFWNDDGRRSYVFDKDKYDVLEYAFEQASRAGNTSWSYIEGILTNIRNRKLKTRDDCEEFDDMRGETE